MGVAGIEFQKRTAVAVVLRESVSFIDRVDVAA